MGSGPISSQVEVTDTSTLIESVHRLKNTSSGETIIYIGGTNLTTDNGYPLAVGDEVELSGNDIHVVVATGTGEVSVLSI